MGRGKDDARTTGRGFLVITGAKAWFFVAAFALNFGLPVLLGSPADYGTYGVIVNAVSLLNMVVIAGTLQAVSKVVAEQPEHAGAVARRAMLLQAFLGVPLALIYFALAEPIAGWLRDPSYVPLLRVSAGIVLAYSFYAIFVGVFNGLKEFTRQAALDIIFATLRTGLILAAVAAGFGVFGALAGFVLASVVIAVFAGFWLWRRLRATRGEGLDEGVKIDGKRLFGFLLSTMIYVFVLNLVMRIDLFALKRLSAEALQGGADPEGISNALTGAYNLMLNVARIPYQAVIAVAFVIFPLLSKSTFESDRGKTKTYIEETMRYTFMIVGLFTAVLVGGGEDMLRPLFPDYVYAAPVLVPMGIGYAFFALFYVLTTMFIAAGRPWTSTSLTLMAAVLLAGGCAFWGGQAEVGDPLLMAVAISLVVSMGVALLVAAGVSRWRYGGFLSLKSGVRLTLVTAAVLALGIWTSFDGFVTFVDPAPGLSLSGVGEASRGMMGSKMLWLLAGVGKAAGLGLIYVVGLLISGEIGAEDRARVLRVLGRKKDQAGQEAGE